MILLFWVIGLIFVGLAIPLMRRKVRPNQFYGLRVAETLENEAVWYEANARPGKYLLWSGLGTIAISSALFNLPWRDLSHYVLVCCGMLVFSVVLFALHSIRTARIVKGEMEEAAVMNGVDGEEF